MTRKSGESHIVGAEWSLYGFFWDGSFLPWGDTRLDLSLSVTLSGIY